MEQVCVVTHCSVRRPGLSLHLVGSSERIMASGKAWGGHSGP